MQSANSQFLSPAPNTPVEGDKSVMGDQQFDLHDFLYEFGLTLNQIFSLLFGLNLKIEKSDNCDKSEQGGMPKNPEYHIINFTFLMFLSNEIDMKTFINGMIEEQKQADYKCKKIIIDFYKKKKKNSFLISLQK